jgi:hypothetical protein
MNAHITARNFEKCSQNWLSGRLTSLRSKRFVLSAVVALLVTGLAKLYAALGAATILAAPDPIFAIPNRLLFIAVGTFELTVAAMCFIGHVKVWSLAFVAWIATALTIYRVGIWSLELRMPCPCLGTLTEMLHLSPKTADAVALILLAYLLVGSYFLLLTEWSRWQVAEPKQVRSCP